METANLSGETSEYWDKFFRPSLTANCNHERGETSVFAGYNHAALVNVKTQFRSLQGQCTNLYAFSYVYPCSYNSFNSKAITLESKVYRPE